MPNRITREHAETLRASFVAAIEGAGGCIVAAAYAVGYDRWSVYLVIRTLDLWHVVDAARARKRRPAPWADAARAALAGEPRGAP